MMLWMWPWRIETYDGGAIRSEFSTAGHCNTAYMKSSTGDKVTCICQVLRLPGCFVYFVIMRLFCALCETRSALCEIALVLACDTTQLHCYHLIYSDCYYYNQ